VWSILKRKESEKKKQPQIGGAAAAAWEHHLTAEAKEKLGEEYAAELRRKHDRGKNIVLTISAVNLGLALVSIFIYFNTFAFIAQILLSIILFFAIPGNRVFFPVGVIVIIFLSQGGWTTSPDYGVFRVVLTAINTFFLAISTIVLFANQNVSDYLYTKRYG